eukprot:TRINITY_DN2953_c0_g1_i1.p1 TRINITY_DN2953_c0_g1~~TRINITY_DN2953_c0_g1_i1.p1  ORF type:complete len:427 (+),score=117.65 TRINITY_DN2953_c0_g1_i1:113-1393(+)
MHVVAFHPDGAEGAEGKDGCPVAVAWSSDGAGGPPLYQEPTRKTRYLLLEEAGDRGVCAFGVSGRWAVVVNHCDAAPGRPYQRASSPGRALWGKMMGYKTEGVPVPEDSTASPRRLVHHPHAALGQDAGRLIRGADLEGTSALSGAVRDRQVGYPHPPHPACAFFSRSAVLASYVTGKAVKERAYKDPAASVETQTVGQLLVEMGLQRLLPPSALPAVTKAADGKTAKRARSVRGVARLALTATTSSKGKPSKQAIPTLSTTTAAAAAASEADDDPAGTSAAPIDIIIGNAMYAYYYNSRDRSMEVLAPGWYVYADKERGFVRSEGAASFSVHHVAQERPAARDVSFMTTAAYTHPSGGGALLDFSHTILSGEGAETAGEVRYRLPVAPLEADTAAYRERPPRERQAGEGRRRRGGGRAVRPPTRE